MISKKTKVVLVCIITMLCMFICLNKVYAIEISPIEYTEEYKQWLELPDEEKKTKTIPRMFNIGTNSNSNNIFSQARILRNTLIDTKFDLRDIISTNLAIRSQGDTNACWAFATLSSLETNLAYNDYKNNKTNEVYDFSESHMDYSTSQSFNDGNIENGFTREVGVGGNFQVGGAYLTNGQGAVLESDMPFISTKENILLKDIENKEVVTKVTDTEEFNSYTNTIELNELMTKMKEHIKEDGSISAGIYGAEIFSDYYNNATGAIYCNNDSCEMNHNISIIGWDDNYSIDNFNENSKPNRNGAWIIRNSWGDKTKIGSINDFKEYIFRQYPERCQTMGWYSKDSIPSEEIIQIAEKAGYTIEDEEVYQPIGDNGFMYVSYEDIHIYKQLFGIEEATTNVDYYNIYQYNDLGYNYGINLNVNKAYLANVFDRDSSEKEELAEVSLNVVQKVKCKVYVNSKNDSKALEDIQPVELKDGDSEIFDAGYHTLEFKKPISITGDKFVIVIEIEALNSNQLYCVSISKTNNNIWDNVEVKDGESYITHGEYFQDNVWIDTVANATDMNVNPSNLTIKAFTKEIVEPTPTATAIPTITPVVTPTTIPVVTPIPTSTSITPMPTVSTTPTITSTPSIIPTNSPSIKPTGLVVTYTTTPRPTSTNKPITTSSTSNTNEIGSVISLNNEMGSTTATNNSSLPYVGKTKAISMLILILSANIVIIYRKYKKIY